MSFVKFVEYDQSHIRKEGIRQKATDQDSFGCEAQARFSAGDVFKPNLVAHSLPNAFPHLLRYVLGGKACCKPARLKDDDFFIGRNIGLKERRWHTGRLP